MSHRYNPTQGRYHEEREREREREGERERENERERGIQNVGRVPATIFYCPLVPLIMND